MSSLQEKKNVEIKVIYSTTQTWRRQVCWFSRVSHLQFQLFAHENAWSGTWLGQKIFSTAKNSIQYHLIIVNHTLAQSRVSSAVSVIYSWKCMIWHLTWRRKQQWNCIYFQWSSRDIYISSVACLICSFSNLLMKMHDLALDLAIICTISSTIQWSIMPERRTNM